MMSVSIRWICPVESHSKYKHRVCIECQCIRTWSLSTRGIYLLTVDKSRMGWWLFWPLIKLFPQAWWKRESSFRADWATRGEGEGGRPVCVVLAVSCFSVGSDSDLVRWVRRRRGVWWVWLISHLPFSLSAARERNRNDWFPFLFCFLQGHLLQ